MIKRSFIIATILISSTIVGLILLGFWQLDRADEKRIIEQAVSVARSKPAQLVYNIDDLVKKVHHQVLLEGYYDNDRQFIYDNQIVNGNVGYYVLTPFLLSDNTAILVNRGFIPWYGSREKLADINVSEDKTTIQVNLIKPKERIEFKQYHTKQFPMLIQSLNTEKLSALLGYQLVPMLAQLEVKSDNGFYREWQLFYGSVDKHLGYAMQWFLMAFVLAFIAIRLLLKNRKN